MRAIERPPSGGPSISQQSDSTNSSIAGRFADLFAGEDRYYGSGTGTPGIVKEPLTPEHWRRHLTGEAPIGIYPLRPDHTVAWGCVDIDEPDFERGARIAALLPAPAFIERTLSGNVHLWVFYATPCPAWAAQGVLSLCCRAEGGPAAEINPKRARHGGEGFYGNYVRLPYAGDERPIVWKTGDALEFDQPYTLENFLGTAEAGRADVGEWLVYAERAGLQEGAQSARRGETDFGDGPIHRCLIYMLEQRAEPITEPGRNEAIYAAARMAFHARDLDDDESREVVEAIAERCVPPLPSGEVERCIRNARHYQNTSPGCDKIAEYADPDCPFVGV